MTCTNCGRLLEADARFCGNCGTSVSEMPRQIAPPELEEPVEGAGISPMAETIVEEQLVSKKKSSAKWTVLIVVIVLVLAAAGVAVWYFLLREQLPAPVLTEETHAAYVPPYAVYLKDDALIMVDGISGDVKTVAEQSGENNYAPVIVSEDGKRVFYTQDAVTDYDTYTTYVTLCWRSLTDTAAEPTVIAKDVRSFTVNTAGDAVIYMDADYALYYYNLKESVKIDDIRTGKGYSFDYGYDYVYYTVHIAADGKSLYYIKDDSTLYYTLIGMQPEKIASDVVTVTAATTDLSVVYYATEDGELYKKMLGAAAEKISDDVDEMVLIAQKDGTIYYGKRNDVNIMDFIENDLPAQAPAEPVMPNYDDYATDAEYEAAFNAYRQELDAYDTYFTQVSIFETLQQNEGMSAYDIYYYDGKESVELVPTARFSGTQPEDRRVFVMMSVDTDNFKPIKLSSFTGDDFYNVISERLSNSAEYYIVENGVAKLSQELKGCEDMMLNADGSKIVFSKGLDDNTECEIYYATVENGEIMQTELITTSSEYIYDYACLADGTFLYVAGESLYADNKLVAGDVTGISDINSSGTKVLYYVEHDLDFDYYSSALMLYETRKEPVEIGKDVYDSVFAGEDIVLFVGDYNSWSNEGTLYMYKDGEIQALDEDVAYLSDTYTSAEYVAFNWGYSQM